jgi:hypothetical protein
MQVAMSYRILSIDVGIKNLSYCFFSIENGLEQQHQQRSVQVLDWQNVSVMEGNCKKTKIGVITDCMLTRLMELFDDVFQADIVLIENQPMLKNGMMKTLSVVIFTYFNLLKIQYGNIKDVSFISATNKLKCRKISQLLGDCGKDTYKDRKKTSVALCKAYIPSCCPERDEWFSKQSKADDVSDSFLQGIYYIESNLKVSI